MNNLSGTEEFKLLTDSWVDIHSDETKDEDDDAQSIVLCREETPSSLTSSIEVIFYENSSRGSSSPDQTDPTTELTTLDDKNERKWVLDWSSQPINQPPRQDKFKHPKRKYTFSLRKSMKTGLTKSQIWLIFVPSLILSNLVAFGVGFYLGRKAGRILPW